jgi:drug/metabolite transporter (DMT)-like permease
VPDPRLRTYLLLVAVVTIWGSYPTLVKLALRDMPPFTLAALRCVLASAILGCLFWVSLGERLSIAQGLGIAIILGGVWMTTRRVPAGERLHRRG